MFSDGTGGASMALTKEDLQAIQALLEAERENTRKIVREETAALREDMAHHNHYVEPLLKAVKDGVDDVLEHNKRIDRLETTADDHSRRIWALEQAQQAQ